MKVYKYRVFNENNISSLVENYFWCSSRETLNDPCEGLFTEKRINQQFNAIKAMAGVITDGYSFDMVEKSYEDYRNLLSNQGIFSTSKSPFIHTLWSLYADNHKGFCIEYDLEELKAKNPSYYNFFDVHYQNEPQDIHFEDMSLADKSENAHGSFFQKVIGTKHTDWSNEQELRIISALVGKNYHRQNAITAIYFGQNCTDKDKNWLMLILANRNIQFKQILKSSNSFSLLAEDITNPFNNKEINFTPAKIEDLAIFEKGIKESYKYYIPYLYKVAEIMQKDPDCEVIEIVDFSQKSTKDNPIIYVNFKEKNKSISSSQKYFTLAEIDNLS